MGMYGKFSAIVRRITLSRVRNRHWAEDAEQEAWIGIIRYSRVHDEINNKVVATIAVNACRQVCRSHKNDPMLVGDMMDHVCSLQQPQGGFLVDLMSFVNSQNEMRRKILEEILYGDSYFDLSELAERLNTSKATCSRTMESLRCYLEELCSLS